MTKDDPAKVAADEAMIERLRKQAEQAKADEVARLAALKAELDKQTKR